ncbi:MAG TPA: SIS domain-containing protein [Vicinamibacterales bacterium]|jgi:D-sedoheptulose 7-phosphate isomerase|nr:SIS domain-containing protein [Vicinamibacterales bacterium]
MDPRGSANAGADLAAVVATLAGAIAAHERVKAGDLAPIVAAAEAIRAALRADRMVLVFGNGGSATDAQHFAAELVGRFERERRGAAVVALTTDTSVLTSVSNDYGFERVFARQVEALGRHGSVAVGISTSGESANVLRAFDAAGAAGMTRIALTGRDGGALGRAADIHVNVPESSTARVQEVHRTILHAICELVERDLQK